MIFRYLQSRCQSAGGTLTQADLDAARSHFVSTFPNVFEYFEKVNHNCAEASGSTAPDGFSKELILATLLMVCGHKPAKRAFEMQMGRFGTAWLNQFFGGLAEQIRTRVPDVDDRLSAAYAQSAITFGAKLSYSDIFKEASFQAILRECLLPVLSGDAASTLAGPLSDGISMYIAVQRGIPKPDISKVTEQQMRNFLSQLPAQFTLSLTGNVS